MFFKRDFRWFWEKLFQDETTKNHPAILRIFVLDRRNFNLSSRQRSQKNISTQVVLKLPKPCQQESIFLSFL